MIQSLKLMAVLPLFLVIVAAAPGHAEPIQIKLGATLPLTGRLAFAGEDIRRGIELAIEEFSTSEVQFTTVFDDNQHETRQAAASAQKLLEIEKVDAVISMWDMADVVAPLAERRKIPHISIRWDPGIADKYSQTLTVESTYRSWVDSTLKLLGGLGARSVAVFTEEGQGWILAADYFKSKASSVGISVPTEERFQSGATDLRSTLLRGLRHSPDYVLFFSNPPNTEHLVTTLRRIAPKQRFTGYFEVVQDLGLIEGLPFVAQFEVAPWFVERFKRRYGGLPKTRAAQGYDIVKLLAVTAARTRTKPTAEGLTVTVRESAPIGAAGPLFISGERTVESACVWKVARDGSLRNFDAIQTESGRS